MEKNTVKAKAQNHSSSATHRTLEKSSTLARKYVKKPTAVRVTATSASPVAKSAPKTTASHAATAVPRPKVASATAVRARQLELQRRQAQARAAVSHQSATTKSRPTAATKDRAAKSAMRSVARMSETTPKMKSKRKSHRILLATVCSAVSVCALFFFVQTNMPDITVKVAAVQTGIDAVYPSHIPRGYSLANVTSEKDGNITMQFNSDNGASFILTEEKSSWDSTALLNNYVKAKYSSRYTTLRERGITIYVDAGDATWVSGGLHFTISSKQRNLTKEQILNLVSSI